MANNLEPNTLVQVADAEFSGIFYLVGAQAGETIDAGFGTIWRDNGEVYYPDHGGELPEGAVRYLGVRFDPGDGYHYGWIGVVRTGMILDALAWGYETQPNTPVGAGVPAPGASGLFLIVAGLTVRRKRIVA